MPDYSQFRLDLFAVLAHHGMTDDGPPPCPRPTRLTPPPDLVRAIHSEPLVAAVWAEAERAGMTLEGALTAVALELLADNVRYRRAEVDRLRGGPRALDCSLLSVPRYCMSSPTVVESAP